MTAIEGLGWRDWDRGTGIEGLGQRDWDRGTGAVIG